MSDNEGAAVEEVEQDTLDPKIQDVDPSKTTEYDRQENPDDDEIPFWQEGESNKEEPAKDADDKNTLHAAAAVIAYRNPLSVGRNFKKRCTETGHVSIR